MTLPDLSVPRTDPPMTPWWTWLALAILTVGAILAAAVLSRQSGHIASNRETAAEVEAISDEVKDVRSEVHYLRSFVDEVKADSAAQSEANRRRIEQVREQAVGAPGEQGPPGDQGPRGEPGERGGPGEADPR